MKLETLLHGFLQVTLPSLKGMPGNYLWLEGTPCYFMNENTLLVPPSLSDKVHHLITISAISGDAIKQPSNEFTIVVSQDALGAVLFYFKKYKQYFHGIAFIGLAGQFPFAPCPSRTLIEGLPPSVIGAIPLLEDWGIPHRLASSLEYPGCFQGTAQALTECFRRSHHFLPSQYTTCQISHVTKTCLL